VPHATLKDGTKLYYEIFGIGEPMVLIGGSGFGRHNLEPLFPYLEGHYTLLSYDQRGYGDSDRTGLENATVETWADDVPMLLDAVGWEKAHINSTSFGSMVALPLAIRHPERCTSLIAQGFFAKPDITRKLMLEAWDDHSRAVGWTRGFAAHLATDALQASFLESNPEVIDQIASMLRDTPADTWNAAHRAMQVMDVTAGLSTCHVPTLIISGEDDWVTPLDTEASGVGARRTAELMPNARLVVFEGAGHVTIVERTKEHAEAIIEFTASLAAAPVAS
jgi:3-oxoadipate enol-lactonase